MSNERLEFLGDAVIDMVIADYLYRSHPEAEEGDMTKMKSRVVSRKSLNMTAVAMGIHHLIETDLQATNSRESISGNAFEAIVGAIYLDRGYKKAKEATLMVLKKYSNLRNLKNTESDFKSRLLEEAHRHKAQVFFKTTQLKAEKGAHRFSSKAFWDKSPIGTGEGNSKKSAEQKAAKKALEKMTDKLTNIS